jgi:REP element-mobilizing transposase RayT
MVRLRRIKVRGDDAYYHIISRTVHQKFLLGDTEKEMFLSMVQKYSKLYFVKVIGYCIMSNHFHLLIKMEPEHKFSDKEIEERVRKNINLQDEDTVIDIKYYRKRLENISEFMRQVKQSFSRWYNTVNKVKGTFWSDRYKSVLIEKGVALETVLAYIELNPIRANMVTKPEDYRYSSFGYRAAHKNSKKQNRLSFDGLSFAKENNAFSRYQTLIYYWGGIEKQGKGKLSDNLVKSRPQSVIHDKVNTLTHKTRYFTDGLVIGSKLFLKQAYSLFGGSVILKKNRKSYQTGLGKELLSIRRLIE